MLPKKKKKNKEVNNRGKGESQNESCGVRLKLEVPKIHKYTQMDTEIHLDINVCSHIYITYSSSSIHQEGLGAARAQ